MCVCLRTKLKASSLILMSFRQGLILPPSPTTTKPTPKKPNLIRVKLKLDADSDV